MGYPSLRLWKARKETTSSARGCGTTSPDAGALQYATSSSTLSGLQFDITPRIYDRIYKFFLSLALLSFLLEPPAAHEGA